MYCCYIFVSQICSSSLMNDIIELHEMHSVARTQILQIYAVTCPIISRVVPFFVSSYSCFSIASLSSLRLKQKRDKLPLALFPHMTEAVIFALYCCQTTYSTHMQRLHEKYGHLKCPSLLFSTWASLSKESFIFTRFQSQVFGRL